MTNRLQQIQSKAKALGFSFLGVIEARPARRLNAYFDWIGAEMHGKMGYLARPDRQIRRQDLNVILPGVQSLICVGLDYETLQLPKHIANDRSRGRISNYAWGADYHDIMTPRLEELAAWIAHQGQKEGADHETQHKVYVDTGAILERDHGETAGLGFTGKNTMLIHPRRGSFFFLGEILTTLRIEPSPLNSPAKMPGCGSCSRCLTACPTQAFPEPYVLDARRCISYLTIELKDEIPAGFRPLMNNWIYGCDDCQTVCPFNRFSQESIESAFRPNHIDIAAPPLEKLLTLTEDSFRRTYANSPIKRIKFHRFMRNVCVAAGNSQNPSLLPQLVRLSQHENEQIKTHAQWAINALTHGWN